MSGELVPDDDLPGSAVPASELPAPQVKPKAFVPSGERNIVQDAFGISPEAQQTIGGFAKAATRGPIGVAGHGMMEGMKGLEDAAYRAGGAVTDVTGSPAAGTAANVAIQAVPTLTGMGIGKKAAPVLDWASRKIMQSAVKPNLAARTAGKADRGINTLLQEGISPTPGGAAKLQTAITQLEKEIDDAIAAANQMHLKNGVPQAGMSVDTQKVAQNIKAVIQDYKMGINQAEDIAAINAVEQRFLNHPAIKGMMQIPVDTAQQMKRGTYKNITDRGFGANLLPNAERDALKAGARGLKEGVAAAVPETVEPMKRQSDLINALKLIEPRIAVEANKAPLGIGWLANSPEMATAFAVERNPWVRGVTARSLYAGRERIPEAIGGGIGGLVGYGSGSPTEKNYVPSKEEPR